MSSPVVLFLPGVRHSSRESDVPELPLDTNDDSSADGDELASGAADSVVTSPTSPVPKSITAKERLLQVGQIKTKEGARRLSCGSLGEKSNKAWSWLHSNDAENMETGALGHKPKEKPRSYSFSEVSINWSLKSWSDVKPHAHKP